MTNTGSSGSFGQADLEDLLRGTRRGQHFRHNRRYVQARDVQCDRIHSQGLWIITCAVSGKQLCKITEQQAQNMTSDERYQLKAIAGAIGGRYRGWHDLKSFVEAIPQPMR